MSTTTTETAAENAYLAGNYAPVSDELTVTELDVTGHIPDHLDGRYVRIGPNPLAAPDPASHHWFLGEGMVHGVRLRDGRAEWYRNRFVRSSAVAEALGGAAPTGPANPMFPDVSPNTNVIANAGRILAISEGGVRPYALTDELDTVGPCDFDGTLPVGWTAHPHADPATGELHAVSYFFGWENTLHYTVLGTDGRITRQVEIGVHGAPMVHDFSLTDRHVIVYDLPVRFDLDMVTAGDRFPYRWDPEYPARVGVMARHGDGSDVRWFDVEPCYVFHPMNAYEDGNSIVIDLARHPRMFDAVRLGPAEGPPTLDRWTIDLARSAVTETRLDERGHEFPRIDERLTGRPHRYGYTVSLTAGGADLASAVFRHDLVAGRADSRTFGPDVSVSEFVFVPSSSGASEDDGVLMGYTHDRRSDESTLTLLDAETLDTVASVAIPARIPYGFHGNWISAERRSLAAES
jgi:carotenoid cleavage dioxygenase